MMCQMHLPNRKISQMRSYLFRTRPSIPFANEELGQWIWKCSESMCRIMYFYQTTVFRETISMQAPHEIQSGANLQTKVKLNYIHC